MRKQDQQLADEKDTLGPEVADRRRTGIPGLVSQATEATVEDKG